MGMRVKYRRMSEAKLQELEADPEAAVSLLLMPPGIDPQLMADLATNPYSAQARLSEIEQVFEKARADPSYVDLDKGWHALHFLLTGDSGMEPHFEEDGPSERDDDPLFMVVMGGRPLDIEMTYGPVRCFSPEDISNIVSALSEITVDDLRSRFSADEFNEADIYPNAGEWSEYEVESVYAEYPRLVKLFEDAQDANEVIIVHCE